MRRALTPAVCMHGPNKDDGLNTDHTPQKRVLRNTDLPHGLHKQGMTGGGVGGVSSVIRADRDAIVFVVGGAT